MFPNRFPSKIYKILFALIFAINSVPVHSASNAGKVYIPLTSTRLDNSNLRVSINSRSLNLNLARTRSIRLKLSAGDLYSSAERVSSVKIDLYEVDGVQRNFVATQVLTVNKRGRRNRIVTFDPGPFATTTKDLEVDVYDTEFKTLNTYRVQLTASNLASQVSNVGIALGSTPADCNASTFDDCQLDYLFKKVSFEVKPQTQASVGVIKKDNGIYKVSIPVPRNQFKLVTSRVKRTRSGGGSGGGGDTGYGENVEATAYRFGTSLDYAFWSHDSIFPQANLSFSSNETTPVMVVDEAGRLGVGVTQALATLHLNNGDATYPTVLLQPGVLTTSPHDGALEYDGTKFYYTTGGVRSEFGSGGTTIGAGSIIEAPILNGDVSVSSTGTLRVNGSLLIPSGASNGKVLTSDALGNATWQDPASIATANATLLDGLDSTDFLQNGNNLSDLSNASLARTNLGLAIGTNVQAFSSNLASIATQTFLGDVIDENSSQTLANKTLESPQINGTASLESDSFLKLLGTTQINGSILIPNSAAAGKVLTSNSVGNATWQSLSTDSLTLNGLNSSAFLQNGDNLSDLENASTARSNLGLAIGTNVQAFSSNLAGFALKSVPTGALIDNNSTQTLLNKTLTSPTLNTPSIMGSGGSIVLPASGTLVTTGDLSSYATSSQLQNFVSAPVTLSTRTNGLVMSTGSGNGVELSTITISNGNNLSGVGTINSVVLPTSGTIATVDDLTNYATTSSVASNYLAKANNLSDLVDPAAARHALQLEIGTDVQAFNGNLTSLSNKAIDSLNVNGSSATAELSVNGDIEFTGTINGISLPTSGTLVTTGDLNNYITLTGTEVLSGKTINNLILNGTLSLNGDVGTEDLVLTSNGAGLAPVWKAVSTTGGGNAVTLDGLDSTDFLQNGNNLSDLSNASLARTNLGLAIGTNVQAFSSNLAGFALKSVPTGALIDNNSTQTLLNKTLTSPTLNTPSITGSGGSIVLPASGTLVTTGDLSSYATSSQLQNFVSAPVTLSTRTNGLVMSTGSGNGVELSTITISNGNNLSGVGTINSVVLPSSGTIATVDQIPSVTGLASLTGAEILTSKTITSGVFNGTSLIQGSSTLKVNGSLLIPSGAGNGKVLTSNIAGVATWQDISALPAGNASQLDGFESSDFLKVTNNLSDLENASTARSNLGLVIGTNVQAFSSNLATLAGQSLSGSIVDTSSSQVLSNKTINGGTLTENTIDGLLTFTDNASILGDVHVNGTVFAEEFNGGVFSGDGSGLTNLSISQISGTITATNGVTAATAFTAANHLLKSSGAGRGSKESGISVDDSNNISNVGTIGSGSITSTGTVQAALVNGTKLNGDALDITGNARITGTLNGVNLPSTGTIATTGDITSALTNYVTLTGSDKLTNKTITSGVFNGISLIQGSSTLKVNGSLLIPSGAVAGHVLTADLAGNATWQAPSGGGGGVSVGGADTYIQYNNANTLYGESAFSYNDTSNTLTVPNINGQTLRASSKVIASNGTAANPSYVFDDANDSGIFGFAESTEYAIGFSVGGAKQMSINGSGMVAIGKDNATSELDVAGTVTATEFSGNGTGLTDIPASAITGTITATNGVTAVTTFGTDNGLLISDGTGRGSALSGISITGSSKNNLTTTGTIGSGAITSTGTVNGNKLIAVQNINGASLNIFGASIIGGAVTGSSFTSSASTGNALVINGSVLVVNATTNNVGIGDSTPDETLDVNGNAIITGNLKVNGNLLTSTGTIELPSNGTLVTTAGAQTLTNKTLTSPTINSIVLNGTLSLNGDVGTEDLVLTSNGAGLAPVWKSVASLGGGAVSEIPVDPSSASAPGYYFTGLTGSGLYSNNSGAVGIATSGTSRIFVAESGNIGIGTESPATMLDLRGDLESNSIKVDDGSEVSPAYSFQSDSNTGIYMTNSGLLGFAVDSNTELVVHNQGVGIGTSSPDVGLALDVVGNVGINGTLTVDNFRMTNSPVEGYVLTSDATGNAIWQAPSGGGGGSASPAGIDAYIQYNNGGVFGAESAFSYNDTSNTLTVPNINGQTLRASSKVIASNGTAANPSYVFDDANDSGIFGFTDSTEYAIGFSVGGAKQMSINGSGMVAIGKDNATSELDVAGTVTATEFSGNGTGLTDIPASAITGIITATNGVTAATAFTAANNLLKSSGAGRGSKESGILVDDSNNISNVGTIGSGSITSTGTIQASLVNGTKLNGDALDITGLSTFGGNVTLSSGTLTLPTINSLKVGSETITLPASGTLVTEDDLSSISSLSAPDGEPAVALNINDAGQAVFKEGLIVQGTTMNIGNGSSASITTSGVIRTSAGTNGAPAHTFSTDLNTGMYSVSNGVLALATQGSRRATIDASGNVGIGESSPLYTLDVNGTLNLNGSITMASGTTIGGFSLPSSGSQLASTADIPSTTNFVTAATTFGTDNVLLRSDGTGRGSQSSGITIDDSNNVSGVGTFSSGTITTSGVIRTSAGTNGAPAHTFSTDLNTGMYSVSNGVLALATQGSRRATIDASGNVGIGESSPLYTLDVNGTLNLNGSITMASGTTIGGFSLPSSGSQLASTADIPSTTNFVTAATTFGTDNVLLRSDGTGRGSQSSGITIDDSNNVSGVGTFSSGTITTSGVIRTSAGTNGAPAHTFSTDLNTGMYSVSNGVLALATQGSRRATIDASGNVGIGESSPLYTLDVNGTLNLNGSITMASGTTIGGFSLPSSGSQLASTADIPSTTNFVTAATTFGTDNVLLRSDGTGRGSQSSGITIDDSNNVSGVGTFSSGTITTSGVIRTSAGTNGAPAHTFSTDLNTGMYSVSNGVLALATQGSRRATIDASGNVGIGESSPLYTLDVNGTLNLNGSITMASGTTIGGFSLPSSGSQLASTADIPSTTNFVTAATTFGTDNVLLRSDGTGRGSQSSGITIDDSNNVSGVGTFSSGTITTSGVIRTSAGTNGAPAHTFSTDLNTGMYSVSNGVLALATQGSRRATIDASGNVGIGESSPLYTLDVNGTLNLNGSITMASGTTIGGFSLPSSGSQLASTSESVSLDGLSDGRTAATSVFLGSLSGPTGFTSASVQSTSLGIYSMGSTTTGDYDTAVGYKALYGNNTGSYNTAVGSLSMNGSTTGVHNTALGYSALQASSIAADYNTAIGSQALFSNNTGDGNTAVGVDALYNNTSGLSNVAIGANALYSNTTGNYNSAFGVGSLYFNNTGVLNAAFGRYALFENTTGRENTAVGDQSMNGNTTGSYNVVVGREAGGLVVGSDFSNGVIMGFHSGVNLTSGDNNILLGFKAGDAVTTGSNNIVIGYDIDAPSDTGSNQLNIGNLIFGTGIDAINKNISTGNIGIGDNSPDAKLDVTGNLNVNGDVTVTGSFSVVGSTFVTTTGSQTLTNKTLGATTFTGAITSTVSTGNALVVNGIALVVNGTTNNVGIGTANPSSALQVVGAISASSNVGAGSFSTAGYYSASGGCDGGGMGPCSESGYLYGGHLSLGSSSEAYVSMNGHSSAIKMYSRNSGVTSTDGLNISYLETTNGLELRNYENAGFTFYTNNTSRALDIASTGNVGIGDSTPDATLDVTGSLNVNGTVSYAPVALSTISTAIPQSGAVSSSVIKINTGGSTVTLGTTASTSVRESSVVDGQMLTIIFEGTTGSVTIVDSQSVDLAGGTITMNSNDVLTLMYSTTAIAPVGGVAGTWIEVSRSNN